MTRVIRLFGTERRLWAEYDEGRTVHLLFDDATITFVWPGGRKGEISSIDSIHGFEKNEEELAGLKNGCARGAAHINYSGKSASGTQLYVLYNYQLGLSQEERSMVQQARLIDAGGGEHTEEATAVETAEKEPAITDVLAFKVMQSIADELDTKARSVPTPSQVFLRLYRDKMKLVEIRRKYGWSSRTLKHRSAMLKAFIWHKYQLSLGHFLGVDRSVFRGVDRMLEDRWARRIRPTAVGECEHGDDDP